MLSLPTTSYSFPPFTVFMVLTTTTPAILVFFLFYFSCSFIKCALICVGNAPHRYYERRSVCARERERGRRERVCV
jgi:hypothetical protein